MHENYILIHKVIKTNASLINMHQKTYKSITLCRLFLFESLFCNNDYIQTFQAYRFSIYKIENNINSGFNVYVSYSLDFVHKRLTYHGTAPLSVSN